MFKVKTFGMEIRPLKTMHELADLDAMVNISIGEKCEGGSLRIRRSYYR